MPKGKLKAKGTVTQGTRVEEPKRSDHQFLCTKEVGTPKASFNRGINIKTENETKQRKQKQNYDTSATPIKKIFSLLTAGKLQASYKQAGRKLKAN